MNRKISILILMMCVFTQLSTVAQICDNEFDIIGNTYLRDDGIKRTEVIFINSSECIIKQKYYDPKIAKEYSVKAYFNYVKKWVIDTIKTPDGRCVHHYEITLHPCERSETNNQPYTKLSNYALQRLNFSFVSPYRNDYYPDGARKECIFRMEDPWDYTPVQERDGYLVNPSSIQTLGVYRYLFDDGWNCNILWFDNASFDGLQISPDHRLRDRYSRNAKRCKLTGKSYVIYDPNRMERFAFINDSLCTYSQFIPIKGDTIEVRQSCKYKQDGYYLALTSLSTTLTDSIVSALKDNEDVCISCNEEASRCFPSSYVYYINVIDFDTLVIDNGVLFYSKVFHFPDHNPIHFYRAYYPTTENIYRFDTTPGMPSFHEEIYVYEIEREFDKLYYPYRKRRIINFGNARVPTNK